MSQKVEAEVITDQMVRKGMAASSSDSGLWLSNYCCGLAQLNTPLRHLCRLVEDFIAPDT